MGKKSDQHQSYKSFVQGCSGSKLKAKYGYKTIIPGLLATGAEREGQQERSFLPLGPVLRWDVGVDCHEAKRPQSPCFWPLWKGGNLVPGLFSDTCSLEHQTWGKDCVGNVCFYSTGPRQFVQMWWCYVSHEGNSHGMSHSRTHVSTKSDKILHLKLHDSNELLQKGHPELHTGHWQVKRSIVFNK